jgi:Flp pilus assembly protein TadD
MCRKEIVTQDEHRGFLGEDQVLTASRHHSYRFLFTSPLCSLYLGGFLFLTWQHSAFAVQESTKDWLAEGKKHVAEGHFAQAVAAFNQFKEMVPEDARPYFFSGIALAEAGHLSAAAAELNEAVRLDPDQPEYVLSLANVLARLGQKNPAVKALAKFEHPGQQDRLSTAGLWQLVDVYYRLQKAEDGLGTLILLSQRTPQDPLIEIHRGFMYKLIGNLDVAEGCFRRSLAISPNSAAAHYELGKLLEQRGDLSSSKNALLDALKRDEANPEYLHALGALCLARNEVDEAIRYLEKAETSGPALPQIYYTLGQAYQRKGDQSKGAKYFHLKKVHEANLAQRQKEIREHEELTLITLGEQKLERGRSSEARALFEQVFQSNPNNWHANEYLAQLFLSSGELQNAYRHVSKLLEIEPNAFEGSYLMADYWNQLRDFKQACTYAEQARSVQPTHAELRNLLGNIYLKLGEPEKAHEEYSAAVRLAPDRTDFRSNLEAASKTR